MATDTTVVAVGATAGIGAAFVMGGFWTGTSTLLAGYICLIGAPSIVALFLETKVLCIPVSFFAILAGTMLGVLIGLKSGLALKTRGKSGAFLFVPLACVAVVLTLRIPDSLARWWSATPWW